MRRINPKTPEKTCPAHNSYCWIVFFVWKKAYETKVQRIYVSQNDNNIFLFEKNSYAFAD